MRDHIQSYVLCMGSLTLSYDMLYTLLCNMHTLKVLERHDCNLHKNSCNCTFEVHTLHCYSNVFLPFQIRPTHCLQHASNIHYTTYTLQGLVHFARHLLYIQVIMTQNVPFLLLTRDQQHICTYEIQTCYSGPTTCIYESLPLQPHSPPAPLVTCMHSQHTTHNDYTNNVLYRTPEGTPIGLVHTHHVTSSRVQLVVSHYKLHHISMPSLSCPVDHVVSVIISAVEHGFHSGGKVFDHIDMATCCSYVQGIASFLQKRKDDVQHLSGTGVDRQLCMCEE